MDFEAFFDQQLQSLKNDGNYREFAELERHRGAFPNATCHNGRRRNLFSSRLCGVSKEQEAVGPSLVSMCCFDGREDTLT